MGAILMVAFALMMALGVPIAISLGFGTVIAILATGKYPVLAAVHRMISGVDSYILLAIPFFILAGQLMNTGGITKKIFRFASALVGHIPGGLGHANIVASIIFSGMSGSAVADAGGLGQVEMEAMTDEGYDADFSAAVTAASATIGPIIPPSIPMVVYGAAAEVSIGALFLGGFFPGLLLGLACMALVYVMSVKRGYPKKDRLDWKEIWVSFKESFLSLLTPVIIIGGILGGIFTPTEAAVIAAVYSFILGFIVYREITVKDLMQMLVNTVVATSTVVLIIGGAASFSWVVAMEGVPQKVASFLLSITSNPYVIILLLNIVFLILGMFMESLSVLLITVPFLMPLITQLGLDPVHLGVVLVLNLMIGLSTPPVGMSLFVCAKIANVKLERLYKAMIPFLVPLIAVLLIVSYFPDTVLLLPRLFLK
ncbi:TRAP transporter large permease [Petroclostridium sp. X23]|uniref:TRAP transporter large permease n=1 Tax=Petroclostridium sp. X23 TaxID=3045146 RepID=UPI0024AE8153|nr:TRAP transporter large permease [Petroclostridium sp. X23]WHH57332.1 TRAP transporter large permease [Petroclostridium sp. X23]